MIKARYKKCESALRCFASFLCTGRIPLRPLRFAPGIVLCAGFLTLQSVQSLCFPPFFVHYAPAGVPTIALCAWHCAVNSFCYASKLSSQAAALRLAPLYEDHPKAHELLIALLLFWYAPLLLCIAIFSDGQLLELCQ